MQRRWFVGLAVVLVVLTAGASMPVSGTSGDTDAAPATDTPQLGTPEGFNDTEFRLTVYENGTTRWTIIHTRILENETQRNQFESFAREFNSAETETFQDFKARAKALTAYGSRETSRQMNATAFSKQAQVEQPLGESEFSGTLQMSFTWTNFAETTERGVTVADVFEGGMYIGPGQSLVISRPSSLVFESASPDSYVLDAENNLTASRTLEYQGEQDFEDQRPRIVMVHPSTLGETPAANESGSGGDATTTSTDAKSADSGTMPMVVAVLLLLLVGGAIAWYSGNLGSLGRDDGGDAGAAAEPVTEPESPAEPEPPAEPAVPEEELLSDEDRVLKLLDENGGRMKQVNIVENTEWSKSKVSMLLSDMEDEGSISKLRVGRENIISKAGEEPDAVGSPFDDE
jgi:uncharacterized membrane protein